MIFIINKLHFHQSYHSLGLKFLKNPIAKRRKVLESSRPSSSPSSSSFPPSFPIHIEEQVTSKIYSILYPVSTIQRHTFQKMFLKRKMSKYQHHIS